MHPDWTLRVPVVRPRGAAWLDGAVMVAAMAAALFALYSLGVLPVSVVSAAVIGGLIGIVLVLSRFYAPIGRRARDAVSAIRVDRDGALYLRMRQGWQPADWLAAWRGPRWLTLRARLPVEFCSGQISFTLWQDRLPAPAWRRACLLANRRLCRTSATRTAGVS